jgi:nitroimidazol reductase NimA-like FMN-containing flavoprotein (pyridoxamine 5'-phosphate oxidase superfamily)
MSADLARAIIRANRYMVLGTADAEGAPWASPVWFATEDMREFVWVSNPQARHSRNLEARPRLGIVIFDSGQVPGTGQAVYMSATASEVPDGEVDAALRVFTTETRAQALPREWTREDVVAPADRRLYRATASEHFVLDARDTRTPVSLG